MTIVTLTEHLGDIVACEPILDYVKNKYPKNLVIWVVNKKYKSILIKNKKIDIIVCLDSLSNWIIVKNKYIKNKSVVVIDLHIDGRLCTSWGLVNKNSNNVNITLDNYYSYGSLLKSFSLSAGINIIDSKPTIYIDHLDKPKIDLPHKYIIIHTESNEESRMWTNENWRILIDRLTGETQIPVIELGINGISGIKNELYHNCCGKFNLREIAYIIKHCNYFIGIDSSFAHFSHSFCVKSLVLLGEYKAFKKYDPYGRTLCSPYLLQHNGFLSTLQVEDVYNMAIKLFNTNNDIKN